MPTQNKPQLSLTAAGRRPKSHYRQMTRAKAAAIRRAYFNREAKQAELAAMNGVKQNTISRIVSGLVWVMTDGQCALSAERPGIRTGATP